MSWMFYKNAWNARIKHKGEVIYLGRFKTEEEAKALSDLAHKIVKEGGSLDDIKHRKISLSGHQYIYRRYLKDGTEVWVALYKEHYIGQYPTVEKAKEAVEAYVTGKPIPSVYQGGSVHIYNHGCYKNNPKWVARLHKANKRVHLGYYDTKDKAQEALSKAINEGIIPEQKKRGKKPVKN